MLAGGSGKKFQKTQKTRLKDFRDRESDDKFQNKKKKHDKSLLRMLRQDRKDSSYQCCKNTTVCLGRLDFILALCQDSQMMKIVKEITAWNVEHRQPNHTYLLNSKGQIVAFAKWHGDEIDELKSRTYLDKRYRKFVEDNHPGLSKLIPKYDTQDTPEEKEFKPKYDRTFNVKSGEKVYTVGLSNQNLTCSCTGFGFRRKCKHVEAVKKSYFSTTQKCCIYATQAG